MVHDNIFEPAFELSLSKEAKLLNSSCVLVLAKLKFYFFVRTSLRLDFLHLSFMVCYAFQVHG